MAKKEYFDFKCPQFVDFERLDSSNSKDDVFFDCSDIRSPENENVCKTPAVFKEKSLSEETENKLIDKMTASLAILESTPKVQKSALKGKLLSAKFLKDASTVMPKSTLKVNTAPVPRAGLKRWKSVSRLNQIVSEKAKCAKEHGLRRSSSLDDLRSLRKLKYPVTPMCLKRTIIKAKSKVVKSTEEMELEEIAKLQKQLKDHLRHNEMTLRRLKMKPRPCVIAKNLSKPQNIQEDKGLHIPVEKPDVAEKEMRSRRNIHTLNHSAMRNVAAKLDNIINGHSLPPKCTDSGVNSKRSKNPSVPVELNEKRTEKIKKHAYNKMLDHSGIIFHAKKNTLFKPFIYESKVKETKTQNAGCSKQKEEPSLPFKMFGGKENIPLNKLQSTVKKTKGMQASKCDTDKLCASNKIVGKQTHNLIRGAPLSENFARN